MRASGIKLCLGHFMTPYRLYFLDALNHILGVEILHSGSDAEAIEAAGGLAQRRGCELWDRDRLVARLVKTGDPSERPRPRIAPEGARHGEPSPALGAACLDRAD